MTQEMGPVEYMAVSFPGNNFTGEITPALRELVDSGQIRIIDMAFVMKDEDGNIAAMEAEELDSEAGRALKAIESKVGDLINDDDLQDLGEVLEPNSSAAILLWEDLWAAKFTQAVRDAGGVLMDIQRVPHELMQGALEWSESHPASL
jgi:uncharacterized membrane protein